MHPAIKDGLLEWRSMSVHHEAEDFVFSSERQARAGQVGRSHPAYTPAAQNQPDSVRKSGDEILSGKGEEGVFAAYRPLISPDLYWAESLTSLEYGGP
jgi:hypothetical protein